MKTVKRIFTLLLFMLAVIYVAAGSFLYYNQEKFLFLNEKLPADHEFWKGEEVNIMVDNEVALSCYYNRVDNAKGVILYFHGNKGSIRRCIRQTRSMEGHGYDIFMPDYRSFGKSDGENINEAQFYEDAQKVYDHLKTIYDESEIVLFGYSLGTAPATYLAANNDPARLYLVSPFYSIVDIVRDYFPLVPGFLFKYPFNNYDNIDDVNCPVDIFYAPGDRVVPSYSSLALKKHIQTAEYHKLINTSHRGAIFHRSVENTLARTL